MKVVVIDGQGGRVGQTLIERVRQTGADCEIIAIGTNAIATAAMLKAGAHNGATGENPAVVACRKADVIIGPIGIVIADSLLGEITPKMAVAVGQADAARILIPMNKCENLIAGISGMNTASLIADAMEKLRAVVEHPST